MTFLADGHLSNNRPAQPSTGVYVTPDVNVHELPDRGQYDAAPPGQTLPLALHHVCPWEVLWKFWNTLVDRKWFGAVRDFAAILGVAKATTSKLPAAMSNNRFADPVPGGRNLDVIICWSVWNLVRGPELRTDDPNAETSLNKKVDFRGYETGDVGARLAALVRVADTMIRVVETPGWPQKDEKMLCEMIGRWTSLAREPLIEFREEMWRIDKRGQPYSRMPSPAGGFVVTHPRWAVRRRANVLAASI